MVSCACCLLPIKSDADGVTCVQCKVAYRRECVRVRTVRQQKDWLCPTCVSKKIKNDSTPLKIENPNPNPNPDPNPNPKPNPNRQGDGTKNDQNVSSEELIALIRREIQGAIAKQLPLSIKTCMGMELKTIKEDLSLLRDLKDSVSFISDEFERLKSEITATKELNHQLKADNDKLRLKVDDLSTRLSLVEQFTRQENLEINGLPEHASENLLSVVVQLGKAVSSTVKENDIVTVTRVRKLDSNSNRPRSIIVKVSNKKIRDEVLASVSKFNRENVNDKLNSRHLGYGGGKSPVFVSEHLSPLNKIIHAETRKAAKEKGYKFVWVRDGRILVRRDEKCQAVQMKCLESIKQL